MTRRALDDLDVMVARLDAAAPGVSALSDVQALIGEVRALRASNARLEGDILERITKLEHEEKRIAALVKQASAALEGARRGLSVVARKR